MPTMAEAKRDFRMGLIKAAEIQAHDFMGDQFLTVALKYSPPVENPVLTDARTKQPRRFKSYDTAVNALREVGFSVSGLAVL